MTEKFVCCSGRAQFRLFSNNLPQQCKVEDNTLKMTFLRIFKQWFDIFLYLIYFFAQFRLHFELLCARS